MTELCLHGTCYRAEFFLLSGYVLESCFKFSTLFLVVTPRYNIVTAKVWGEKSDSLKSSTRVCGIRV